MDQTGQVDPKTLNRFMSWQASASIMLWMLCVGAATAPETSSRISVVLIAGATIYMVIAIGSSFWTGYTREYRKTVSRQEAQAKFYTAQGMLSLGTVLFLFNFSNGYFIGGDSIVRSLMKGLVMGVGVAGTMYMVFVYRRRKK